MVLLKTNRSHYNRRDAAAESITVEELIEELSHYSGTEKVIFSNDGGFTYGTIQPNDIICLTK